MNLKIKYNFLFYLLLFSDIIARDSQEYKSKTSINFLTCHSSYYTYQYLKGNISIKNNNWTIFSEPAIVSENVGKQILGTDFSRLGINGRFTQGYLQYIGKNWSAMLGRKNFLSEKKIENSIIQNGQFPTYDQIRFSLTIDKLFGEFYIGQLGSENDARNRIKRFIAGHSIKTFSLHNKLEFEIGELMLYTGENRSLELFYLNPLVPYILIVPDGDDLSINNNNNDNLMFFISAYYRLDQTLNFFGELIIDDYQYRDDPVQDMLGWKFGAGGKLLIGINNFNWDAIYTRINSWTYIHSDRGQYTTWQNRGHAIGYQYGGDLRSFRFQIDSWLKEDKLWINVEYTWLEKGSNTLQTKSANINTLSDPFPYPPVKVFHLFQSSITYHAKYASLQIGYTNIPFSYEIANGMIDELKGGLFINLKFKYGFDIDLEQN